MALLQTEFRSQALKRTVTDIQIKILNAMKENMPEISSDTLEEGGKVYYMNGKNGTEYNASGRAHDQHPFKAANIRGFRGKTIKKSRLGKYLYFYDDILAESLLFTLILL